MGKEIIHEYHNPSNDNNTSFLILLILVILLSLLFVWLFVGNRTTYAPPINIHAPNTINIPSKVDVQINK